MNADLTFCIVLELLQCFLNKNPKLKHVFLYIYKVYHISFNRTFIGDYLGCFSAFCCNVAVNTLINTSMGIHAVTCVVR